MGALKILEGAYSLRMHRRARRRQPLYFSQRIKLTLLANQAKSNAVVIINVYLVSKIEHSVVAGQVYVVMSRRFMGEIIFAGGLNQFDI